MKLKKGSIEAKRYMAKIRAKKKPVKKNTLSGSSLFDKLKRTTNTAKKNVAYSVIDKTLISANPKEKTQLKKAKKIIQNTNLGYNKYRSSLGASGDYAKFEIAVIKNLSKLLKKPYKKVLEIVNTDDSLLNIISKNFDKKISVSITAKELKAKLIIVAKKSPLQSFVEILNKLPKKDQVSRSVKFPIKLPATVQIGSLNNSILDEIKNKLSMIDKWNTIYKTLQQEYKIAQPQYKSAVRVDMYRVKNVIQDFKQQVQKLKKHIK